MNKEQWKRRYQLYLTTSTWKAKAEACKELAGYRCSSCGSQKMLNAHHHRYPRKLGCERIEDLTCLCRDCHRKIHGLPPVGAYQLLLEELARLEDLLQELF